MRNHIFYLYYTYILKYIYIYPPTLKVPTSSIVSAKLEPSRVYTNLSLSVIGTLAIIKFHIIDVDMATSKENTENAEKSYWNGSADVAFCSS